MQPKNVMLLGFINKAVEYIDKTVDEEMPNERLAGLKNIDLATIKKELSENLDSSLGMMQSTMTSLLKAGEEAFYEFAHIEVENKPSLAERMADEFDTDYAVKKDSKKELANLLKFYSLDTLEFDDDCDTDFTVTEPVSPAKQNEDKALAFTEELKESFKIPEDIFDEVESEENVKSEDPTLDDLILEEMETVEEETPASELDEESKRMLAEIEANVSKNTDEETVKEEVPVSIPECKTCEEKIEEIFTEIEANEQPADEEINVTVTDEPEVTEEKKEDIPSETLVEHVDMPLVIEESETESAEPEITVKEEADPVKEFFEREQYDVLLEELRQKMIKDEEEEARIAEEERLAELEKENEEETSETDETSETETVDSDNDTDDVIEVSSDATDTVENADDTETIEENVSKDTEKQSYISDLIDELRLQMVKEDERLAKEEDERRNVLEEIANAYPYLAKSFINIVYDLKDELAHSYKEGEKIIVLNRIHFKDVDKLRQFVEITLNHNYMINADEDKMIVDIFKTFVNSDGRIISNIFEVANQASLLNGEYEGYRVISEEE